MGESPGIFRKRRLTPRQLRAVAEYRMEDSLCLLKSKDPARANGAMYMAGFVIECLLKALLLERHSNLQAGVDPAKLSKSDAEVYRLLYGHELDEMLNFLPEVEAKLRGLEAVEHRPIWHPFQVVCEQWTVYARYSPIRAKKADAEWFVDTVKEVTQWLKEL